MGSPRILPLAIAIAAVLAWCSPASADPFGPFVNYDALANNVVFAVGDFNSDGKGDVLVTDRDTGGVELFVGDGSGALTRHPLSGLGGYGEAVDVTGDGVPDLLAVGYGGLPAGAYLSQRIADGQGDFGPQTQTLLVSGSLGSPATMGAIADFTGDGKADVAFAATPYQEQTHLYVAPGYGNGSYAPVTCSPVTSPWTALDAVPDLNGDGADDLVARQNMGVSMLLSNGSGCFGAPIPISLTAASAVTAADLDDDGQPELIMGDGATDCIDVVQVAVSGALGASDCFPTDFRAAQLQVGDGNGDGVPDVVYGSYAFQGWQLGILGGGDAGGFDGGRTTLSTGAYYNFALGPLDSDAKPDLVIATSVTLIRVALNTAAPHAEIYPDSLSFPLTTVGSVSPEQDLALANVGEMPFNVTAVALLGSNATSFKLADGCSATRLYPGFECVVRVAFKPLISGYLSASVGFEYEVVGGPHVATVSGSGGPAAATTVGVAPAFPTGEPPSGSTSPSVSPPPTGPTAAQLKAQLLKQLVPSGKNAKIGTLLKKGSYAFSFTALTGGRVVINWYYLPKGPKPSEAKPKAARIASGSRIFSQAGTSKVTIKLTTTGKRVLKRATRLELIAKGSFTPTGQAAAAVAKNFALKR